MRVVGAKSNARCWPPEASLAARKDSQSPTIGISMGRLHDFAERFDLDEVRRRLDDSYPSMRSMKATKLRCTARPRSAMPK